MKVKAWCHSCGKFVEANTRLEERVVKDVGFPYLQGYCPICNCAVVVNAYQDANISLYEGFLIQHKKEQRFEEYKKKIQNNRSMKNEIN